MKACSLQQAANLQRALIGIIVLLSCACQSPNYHLIHPKTIPDQIHTWSQDHVMGELLIHLEWARPKGLGPFATVLVHPHGGKTTEEMKGVIWDLAENGFLAVATDYKRMLDGQYRRTTFMWRAEPDVTYALNIVRSNPDVDKDSMATLGFSQGGMLSLLIAGLASSQLRTVIAYYPVSDFNYWFAKEKRNFIEYSVFRAIRKHFFNESGATTEEEFAKILHDASPINYVETIDVPVLLVHGDADTSARLEESQRLTAALEAAGKSVELMVVADAVHIFNFRQEPQARLAWDYTMKWLQQYLQ